MEVEGYENDEINDRKNLSAKIYQDAIAIIKEYLKIMQR